MSKEMKTETVGDQQKYVDLIYFEYLELVKQGKREDSMKGLVDYFKLRLCVQLL